MTEAIVDAIAANEQVAAPVVALLVAWVLYGVLGKRFLGADDDFWPALRGWLLPKLDAVGMRSGLYATAEHTPREFIAAVDEDIDAFEERLEAAGFYRNPLAAYKTSPQGWPSDGSWARRYGSIRVLGDAVRLEGEHLQRLPVAVLSVPGWLAAMLGRFLQGAGDVLARRQLHVTLFDADGHVVLYGHDEPNSLNPLTAWRHFRARGFDPERGVEAMREELDRMNVEFETGLSAE